MVLDKYDDFFLGKNVTEPVAIEMLVDVKDIHALQRFLENSGFQTTTNGNEKDKILIDIRKNTTLSQAYSIITPALKPEDRKKLYEALKYTIMKYAETTNSLVQIKYPHLLDLKHLIGKRQIKHDIELGEQVQRILRDLEKSDDTHCLDKDARKNIEDIKRLFPTNSNNGIPLCYCGTTVPDPYSVVTSNITRFFRFASTNPGYAKNFTGIFGKKEFDGHQNITPNGKQSIGFVFQYEQQPFPQQLFFNNSGIEFNSPAIGHKDREDETAINRFDNPCVGIYLVWGTPDKTSNKFYIYKISEQDPRYQIIKQYYTPTNAALSFSKNERFQAWLQEGNTHQTYIPCKDGDIEKTMKNADNLVKTQNAKKQKITEIEQEISDIYNKCRCENFSDIVSPSTSGITRIYDCVDIQNKIKYAQQNTKRHDKILKDTQIRVNTILSEIQSHDYLAQHTFNQIQPLIQLIKQKQDHLVNIQNNLEKTATVCDKLLKKLIDNLVMGKNIVHQQDVLNMDSETRKQILQHYKNLIAKLTKYELSEETIKNSAYNLIKIYTTGNKAELFDILCNIRNQSPKDFRTTMKNTIKTMNISAEETEILIELFKNDNLFVNRIKKARKLMILKQGTANIIARTQNNPGPEKTI